LHHTKWLLFTETLPAVHYRYLRAQWVREKARQILSFCSAQFITQSVKITPMYILLLIQHCSTDC